MAFNPKTKIFLFLVYLCAYPATNIAATGTTSPSNIKQDPIEYGITLDKKLSPYSGASLIFTVKNLYITILPYSKLTKGDNLDIFNQAFRFIRVGLDYCLTYQLMIPQHEIFGHGYRMREFNMKNIRYHIEFFKGWARADGANNLRKQEVLAIFLAGSEASFIGSRELSMQFLKDRSLQPLDALFYFNWSLDKTQYILEAASASAHDYYQYINTLNQMYGPNTLTMKQLRRHTYLDYLDPFLIYSIMGTGTYIMTGSSSFEYPMIKIGSINYLPGFRSIITPFGPEAQSIHYFTYKNVYSRIYLNYGDTYNKTSYGIGTEINNLFGNDLLSIGIKVFVWNQPELLTPNPKLAKIKTGGLFSIIGNIAVNKTFNIFSELGYKNKGFIAGEQLRASPIVKLGAKLVF